MRGQAQKVKVDKQKLTLELAKKGYNLATAGEIIYKAKNYFTKKFNMEDGMISISTLSHLHSATGIEINDIIATEEPEKVDTDELGRAFYSALYKMVTCETFKRVLVDAMTTALKGESE